MKTETSTCGSVFDHRLFDGAAAAAILSRLETVLKCDIATELSAMVPAADEHGRTLESVRSS